MILDAYGRLTQPEIATHRDRLLSQADAEHLREYKRRILEKFGYREALWCQTCETREDNAGVRASVTDSKIDIGCRCTTRRYRGQTY